MACISLVSSRPVPPTISGWVRMASATCPLQRALRAPASTAPKPRARAVSEIAQQRGAAAVDTDGGDLLRRRVNRDLVATSRC